MNFSYVSPSDRSYNARPVSVQARMARISCDNLTEQ